MKLSKIEFTNFRCFRSEVVEFSDYTSLVGPNNCGKSTVLRALNCLLNDGKFSLTPADFSVGSEEDAEISIVYEFDEVVGKAAEDLGHYVRNGKVAFELVGRRTAGGVSGKRRGIRYGLIECAPFFAAEKAGERRPIYDELIASGAALPFWKNIEQASAAVRAYEAGRPNDHVRIPSEENAYGATGPVPRLRNHLEWIYVPAVKGRHR
ncbi:MAG: AAA family ATPase [Devosia sp.]